MQPQDQQPQRLGPLAPDRPRSGVEDRPCADLLRILIEEAQVCNETIRSASAVLGTARPALGSAEQTAIDALVATNERLQRSLDGASELASIHQGRLELAHDVFSPVRLVHDVVSTLRDRADNSGVDFRLRVDTEVPHNVSGDQQRLRTILDHVIGMAIPDSHDGQVHLEVSNKPDGRTRFSVSYRKNQLATTASFVNPMTPWTNSHGSPIGLAVAQHLVELMDGSLGYETDDRGTAVWFDAALRPARRRHDHHLSSPPVEPPEATPATPTTPRTDESTPQARTSTTGLTEPRSERQSERQLSEDPVLAEPNRSLHVLVVDDSDVNRLLATSQLERIGHTHETARSGLAALDLMTTGTFDAVLMDWHMPGMNGLEATERWREQHDREHLLPIITMTASAMAGDRERCLAAGASDYLSKPVSIGELASMLNRWCPADDERPNEPTPTPQRSKIDELIADLGDASVVHSIVEAFLDMVPQYRAATAQALESGDRASIHRHAHTLKSTAFMLGTEDLAAACVALESAAKDEDSDLDAAVAEFSRCCREAELTLIDLSAALAAGENRST